MRAAPPAVWIEVGAATALAAAAAWSVRRRCGARAA
jgi:hypothetical protein